MLLAFLWVWIGLAEQVRSETFTLGYLTGSQRRPGHKEYLQPGLTISGAISYAVEEVNQQLAQNGSSHHVEFIVAETYGEEETSVLATARMWRDQVSAYIGPQETCVTEARMAASFNLPMISYFCTQPETSNKKLFRTFARTRPPASQIARSVASLLLHFDWRKVALLYRGDQQGEMTPVAETLLATFRQAGVQIVLKKVWTLSVQYPYQLDIFNSIVDSTYLDVRVYVILGSNDEHLSLLSAMQRRNLLTSGEYQVVGVNLECYRPDAPSEYLKGILQKMVDPAILPAYKGYLAVFPTAPVSMDIFSRKVNEYLTKPPFNYTSGLMKVIPPEAGYLYDAVKLYVRAVLMVLQQNEDPKNGTAIINAIKGMSYLSGLGYRTYIDENGDAQGNYTLLALRSRPEAGKGLYPVGIFTSSTNYSAFPKVELTDELKWILGRPPLSEPVCGFHGDKCLNYTWQKVGIVIGVLLIIGAIAMFLIYRNWRYEQELDSLLWKLDFKDIQLSEEETGQNGNTTKLTRTTHPLMRTSQVSLSSNPDADFRYSAIFTTIGMYKGQVFAIRKVNKKSIDISRAMKKELKMMRDLRHDNINPFIGACTDPPNICIVSEYCARGSLRDILDNETIRLDNMFIASLVSDLIRGITFLHDSPVRYHGRLKPSNCLIDPRWVLKICDYGLRELKIGETEPEGEEAKEKIIGLLYRAPELLRLTCVEEALVGSQKGDVYSFAVILYELHSRRGPFGETSLNTMEILERVKSPLSPPFRPPLDALECGLDYVRDCLNECWAENPDVRPDFKSIRSKLRPMKKGMKPNIVDNMMSMMEKYTNDLEALVDERTDQLVVEKKKTEALLHEMLPRFVADQLKRGLKVEAEQYDCVTIYFSDVVGFTAMSAQSSPLEVVDFLNDLYTCFDSILENFDVYKVETIGDAYMVVSGLPLRNGNQHAAEIASMSLQLVESVRRFRIRHRPNDPLMLRVGLHSGPVCAGVVGLKMPRYCLFGDTVNTASRMESTGTPGRIHISSATKALLDHLGGYVIQERGIVRMKGKGDQLTFWLMGEEEDRRKPSPQAGLRSSLKNKRLDNSTRRGPLARCSSLESPKRLRFASADLLEFQKLDGSKDPLLEVIIDNSPNKKLLLDVHTNSEHVRRASSSCPCIENISALPATCSKPKAESHGDCNGNIQIFIDPDDVGVDVPLLTS